MNADEMARLARQLASGAVAPDDVDWPQMSDRDRRDLIALVGYEIRQQRLRRALRGRAQRRARGLLCSLLSTDQRAELGRRRYVTVVGSAGGIYRLFPGTRGAQRVVRHGRHWYAAASYCLHDPENELPPADVTVAQMLLLMADEPAFLATANATPSFLWDGQWLRRLRARRREEAGRAVTAEEGRG